MNKPTATTENFIVVIPFGSMVDGSSPCSIRIEKLCYWHDRNCEHPVNDGTVGLFLRNADLYNVSVYPAHPDLGWYAMDSDIQPDNGEAKVHEIYYKGNLIYRDC